MHISGVLVHVLPSKIKAVSHRLNMMPGIEVHAAEDGKLVITVENEKLDSLADQVNAIHQIKGVLSVAMVYHESEETSSSDINSNSPQENILNLNNVKPHSSSQEIA